MKWKYGTKLLDYVYAHTHKSTHRWTERSKTKLYATLTTHTHIIMITLWSLSNGRRSRYYENDSWLSILCLMIGSCQANTHTSSSNKHNRRKRARQKSKPLLASHKIIVKSCWNAPTKLLLVSCESDRSMINKYCINKRIGMSLKQYTVPTATCNYE